MYAARQASQTPIGKSRWQTLSHLPQHLPWLIRLKPTLRAMTVCIERRTHQVFDAVLSGTLTIRDAQPVYVEHIKAVCIVTRCSNGGVVLLQWTMAVHLHLIIKKPPQINEQGFFILLTAYILL